MICKDGAEANVLYRGEGGSSPVVSHPAPRRPSWSAHSDSTGTRVPSDFNIVTPSRVLLRGAPATCEGERKELSGAGMGGLDIVTRVLVAVPGYSAWPWVVKESHQHLGPTSTILQHPAPTFRGPRCRTQHLGPPPTPTRPPTLRPNPGLLMLILSLYLYLWLWLCFLRSSHAGPSSCQAGSQGGRAAHPRSRRGPGNLGGAGRAPQ